MDAFVQGRERDCPLSRSSKISSISRTGEKVNRESIFWLYPSFRALCQLEALDRKGAAAYDEARHP